MKIPVSVIIVTKNEEGKINTCLDVLKDFDEVVVVDSQSQDRTAQIVKDRNVALVDFIWNRQYPKKRQWCLDHLELKHDWVFFLDADEIVTDELIGELRDLFQGEPETGGYFIRGHYLMNGKILKHGWQNNKIALLDRRKMEFPVIDDLDIPGMGEIEGHYQPVLKAGFGQERIAQIKAPILHDAMDDERAWIFRHQKYARWETGMNKKNIWPRDPKPWRDFVKKHLRHSKFRPQLVFFISYILMLGFLDGKSGYDFAKKKKQYCALILP